MHSIHFTRDIAAEIWACLKQATPTKLRHTVALPGTPQDLVDINKVRNIIWNAMKRYDAYVEQNPHDKDVLVFVQLSTTQVALALNAMAVGHGEALEHALKLKQEELRLKDKLMDAEDQIDRLHDLLEDPVDLKAHQEWLAGELDHQQNEIKRLKRVLEDHKIRNRKLVEKLHIEKAHNAQLAQRCMELKNDVVVLEAQIRHPRREEPEA